VTRYWCQARPSEQSTEILINQLSVYNSLVARVQERGSFYPTWSTIAICKRQKRILKDSLQKIISLFDYIQVVNQHFSPILVSGFTPVESFALILYQARKCNVFIRSLNLSRTLRIWRSWSGTPAKPLGNLEQLFRLVDLVPRTSMSFPSSFQQLTSKSTSKGSRSRMSMHSESSKRSRFSDNYPMGLTTTMITELTVQTFINISRESYIATNGRLCTDNIEVSNSTLVAYSYHLQGHIKLFWPRKYPIEHH
jgi:hypothetical protein